MTFFVELPLLGGPFFLTVAQVTHTSSGKSIQPSLGSLDRNDIQNCAPMLSAQLVIPSSRRRREMQNFTMDVLSHPSFNTLNSQKDKLLNSSSKPWDQVNQFNLWSDVKQQLKGLGTVA